MSNIKSPISLEILQTGDGSPTLSLNGGEKMHSMEGAFSESLYIYGSGLDQVANFGFPIKVLSMGLGLSYNEWIALAIALKNKKQDIQIHSFEKVDFLNQLLAQFLSGQDNQLTHCYKEVIDRVADHFEVPSEELFHLGKACSENSQWKLHSALSEFNESGILFNTILYDAFSSGTDDDLWTEEHFENFLIQYCDPDFCLFTTYAATGNLKRSLNNNGFLLKKKAGFGKKRESTLGIRSRRAFEKT